MFDNAREIIDAVLAIVLAAVVGCGVYLYKDRQYKALELKYSQASQKAEQAAITDTATLASDTSKDTKEESNELTLLNTNSAALINSVRSRPSRPASMPVAASAPSTCTGAQLYGDDSEFLAREAARADQAVIERDFYYQQYENARLLLNSIAGQKSDGGQNGTVSNAKSVP